MSRVNTFVPIRFRERALLFMIWFCVVFFGLATTLILAGVQHVVADGAQSISLETSTPKPIAAQLRSLNGVTSVRVDNGKTAGVTVVVSPRFWMTDAAVSSVKRIALSPDVDSLVLPAPETQERVRLLGWVLSLALLMTILGFLCAAACTIFLLRTSVVRNVEYLTLMERFGTSKRELRREAWSSSINVGVFSGVMITFSLVVLLVSLQGFLMDVEDVAPLPSYLTWPLVTAPLWMIPIVFTGASSAVSRQVLK